MNDLHMVMCVIRTPGQTIKNRSRLYYVLSVLSRFVSEFKIVSLASTSA